MTKLFHLDQYTRHDRNARYSSCQVPVTDEQTIARLEAEYRANQFLQALRRVQQRKAA